jgi:hypothetical protein
MEDSMKKMLGVVLTVVATVTAGAAGAVDLQLAQGGYYGPPRPYQDAHRGDWAVGTFQGQNGANGAQETITIHRDGSAEVRTRGEEPKQGTFAGETLTLGSRISKVQPARGGIVIDGAYYARR